MVNVNALIKMHKVDGKATNIAEVFGFSFFSNETSYKD